MNAATVIILIALGLVLWIAFSIVRRLGSGKAADGSEAGFLPRYDGDGDGGGDGGGD